MIGLRLWFWNWRLRVANRKYYIAVAEWKNGDVEYAAISRASERWSSIRYRLDRLEKRHDSRRTSINQD